MKTIRELAPLLIIPILFGFPSSLFAQDWLSRIKPIETNISELSEILDSKPIEKPGDTLFFKLKEGNVFIEYSLGKCVSGSWGAWNVEKGKVVSLTYYPKKMREPSKFNLNSDGMTKGLDSGHQTFTSKEKGVYYSTQFGKVMSIILSPPIQFEHLRCKKQDQSEKSESSSTVSGLRFGETKKPAA